jgi:hypothetical protein
VSEYIGKLRHSVPGVGLISPPPHHDIYSIEDLAQLIHDLKNANGRASVSVKLVSEVGSARSRQVSRRRRQTMSSSPVTMAAPALRLEFDQARRNTVGARPRRDPADAGAEPAARTHSGAGRRPDEDGRDVVIGALLGADEFGFATAPLVAEGCIMMRKCHLNTCPVGVATQDPVLRAKFQGRPEHVVNFLFFVAEEARSIMAQLGIATFDELIGRSDLLDARKGIEHWKARGLDFSRILHVAKAPPEVARPPCRDAGPWSRESARRAAHRKVRPCARSWREGPAVGAGPERQSDCRRHALWRADPTPPGRTARPEHLHPDGGDGRSELRRLPRQRHHHLPDRRCQRLHRQGDERRSACDPPSIDFRGDSTQNIIVGNTVLYGATSGEAFFRGVAGERFAVRLSGATAVVEGTGDHGCEYMTGGTVVVLGKTGRNFAAGMSGGISYVFDEDGQFESRCNTSMVSLGKVVATAEQEKSVDRAIWHKGQCDEAI